MSIPRALSRAAAVVAALGIFVPLAMVLKRSVDMPYWDEWEWAGLVYAAHTHTLSFEQLWWPHNEHRLLIPNLLMLGLDALGGWDVVREQLVSVALLGLTQLAVWQLIRRTVRAERAGLCFLVTSAVLLGLSQYENFQWGFQMAWFICDLGAVAVVWLMTRPHRAPRDVALAVLVATAASVSSSQGLVAWACGLVAIALVPRRAVPTAVVWTACAAFVYAVVRPGSPTSGGLGHVGLGHPGLLLHYAVIYLGSPLAGLVGMDQSAAAGVALLLWLALLAAAAYRGSARVRLRLAPWLALAVYPLLCSLVTASGRAALGLGQAESSRYTSIGALAWVAAIAATFAAVPLGRVRAALAAAPALVVLLLSLRESADGNHEWREHAAMLRRAQAGIAAGDTTALQLVYPDAAHVTELMRELAVVHDGIFSGR